MLSFERFVAMVKVPVDLIERISLVVKLNIQEAERSTDAITHDIVHWERQHGTECEKAGPFQIQVQLVFYLLIELEQR